MLAAAGHIKATDRCQMSAQGLDFLLVRIGPEGDPDFMRDSFITVDDLNPA